MTRHFPVVTVSLLAVLSAQAATRAGGAACACATRPGRRGPGRHPAAEAALGA